MMKRILARLRQARQDKEKDKNQETADYTAVSQVVPLGLVSTIESQAYEEDLPQTSGDEAVLVRERSYSGSAEHTPLEAGLEFKVSQNTSTTGSMMMVATDEEYHTEEPQAEKLTPKVWAMRFIHRHIPKKRADTEA